MSTPPTSSATQRRKKHHVAVGARIATAGIGLSSMLGMLGAFGASVPTDTSARTSALVTEQPSIVIVHPSGAVGTRSGAVASAPTRGPITLRANPVVRTVEVTPTDAPVARTNASR